MVLSDHAMMLVFLTSYNIILDLLLYLCLKVYFARKIREEITNRGNSIYLESNVKEMLSEKKDWLAALVIMSIMGLVPYVSIVVMMILTVALAIFTLSVLFNKMMKLLSKDNAVDIIKRYKE